MSQQATQLVQVREIGRISAVSEDSRETICLFQKLFVAQQREMSHS